MRLSQFSDERLLKMVTTSAVIISLCLVGLKVYAVYLTHSVSMMASLVDSLMDVGASLINLIAIRVSLAPADFEHRFGHGKAEALAGFCQSVIIGCSALYVFYHAYQQFVDPTAISHSGFGLIVSIIAIGMTIGLLLFQRYVIKRTNSPVVKADALHYFTDLLTNAGVVLAMIAVSLGILYVDAIVGVLIGVIIIKGSIEIGKQSVDILMDREHLLIEDEDRFYQAVFSEEGVLGVHDLRSRQSGRDIFIQLHLELPDEISLREAHRISDAVECKLALAFPNTDIIIHEDPISEVSDLVVKNRVRREEYFLNNKS